MDVRQLRDFYDLRQISQKKLGALTSQALPKFRNVVLKDGFGIAQASFSRFWPELPKKSGNAQKTGLAGPLSPADIAATKGFLENKAKESGRELIFSKSDQVKIFDSALVIPASSLPGISLWDKISPQRCEETISQVFSFLTEGMAKPADYLQGIKKESRGKIAFGFGMLIGGTEFLISEPEIDLKKLASTPLEPLKYYPKAIDDYILDEKCRIFITLNSVKN